MAADGGNALVSALTEDERETLPLLELAADAGHAEAQYTLAKMYRAGKGVGRNDARALHFFQMAASQGHCKALCNVGTMYETGRGVIKSLENAAKYYARAAKAGDPKAAFNLSIMYKNGSGVEQNAESAQHFLRVAAENGFEKAQYNIGVSMLKRAASEGDNGSNARQEAEQWLEKAAEKNANKAHYTLAVCAEREMKEAEEKGRDVDEDKVTERYAQAAAQGHPKSQFIMGTRWLSGKGVPKADASAAAEYFRMGLESGDAASACNLGYLYETGKGVQRSIKDALACYEAGARAGDAKCQFNAAKIFRKGVPGQIEKNKEMAYAHFRDAAEQGYHKAQYNLAMMILKGEKVVSSADSPKQQSESKINGDDSAASGPGGMSYSSITKSAAKEKKNRPAVSAADVDYAVNLLERASEEHNDPKAMYSLGIAYLRGDVVDRDFSKAFRWIKRAAVDCNDSRALYKLATMHSQGWGTEKNHNKALECLSKASEMQMGKR